MSFQLDSIQDQTGRIAIVTGANSGLGFETTLALTLKGIKVIMACRSIERAESAKTKLLAINPNAKIDILELDLSELSSVHLFAKRFKENYPKLDLLINNAGIMYGPYFKTVDGFEGQLGTNYLGHFLLTLLLINEMPNNSDSRIVAISSVAHKMGKIHLEDFQSDKKYSSFVAYNQSKLACLMFGFELQRRLEKEDKNILSVIAHPGGSDTDLMRSLSRIQVWLLKKTIAPLVIQDAKKGALPILMAALSSKVSGGEYYGPQGFLEMTGLPGIGKKTKYSQNKDIQKLLWKKSEELTKIKFGLKLD